MSDHIDEDDGLFVDEPIVADGESAERGRAGAAGSGSGQHVDVLAGAATSVRRDPRERIRNSRIGQLIVVLVTVAVVIAGAQIVRMQQASDAASQTGGATVVTLPGNSNVPPPKVGQPAQDFTLTTIDGQQITLSELQGKAVWLAFGASWCSACQAEMPDIQDAHLRYADRGVVVLGINIQESNETVKAYAQRIGLTFPIGADPTSAIADAYAVGAIPAHYFVAPDGVMKDIRVGGLAPATMDQILDSLVEP